MKNHFYISYFGNKRNEVIKIFDKLNFEGITTIVEPYCGTSAVSYYISTKKKNLKYVLNDNNKFLKQMYDIIKDDTKVINFEDEYEKTVTSIGNDKQKYNEIVRKKDSLIGWFIANKVYAIRPGMFPIVGSKTIKKTIKLSDFPIYDFYRKNDITFTCDDAIKCYEQYRNKKDCMIIMDPPYISTCNDFYVDNNMNIYEYIFNNDIDSNKAKIYFILENIWIIQLLFKKYNKLSIYDKTYETTRKKTNHVIICNKNGVN